VISQPRADSEPLASFAEHNYPTHGITTELGISQSSQTPSDNPDDPDARSRTFFTVSLLNTHTSATMADAKHAADAPSDITTRNATTSLFLQLPAELRNEIYK
jgi:hypothetical protein